MATTPETLEVLKGIIKDTKVAMLVIRLSAKRNQGKARMKR